MGLSFLAMPLVEPDAKTGPPLEALIQEMGRRAREAALQLATLSTQEKNRVLESMAGALLEREDAILEANAGDVQQAIGKGLNPALIERLRLDPARVAAMAGGIRQVAALPDFVGEILAEWTRPNGLQIRKVRVPIGVIAIIYESRPNVTSDAASLCFKSGNATILRGGSEAFGSNAAIAEALASGGAAAGLPEFAIQFVPVASRETVTLLAHMDRYLDLIIPRGGKSLIETVTAQARMPVIKHYDGICHVYVDSAADLSMACALAVNAKCQKPGVCNAMETLLVHRDIAAAFCPLVAETLRKHGVELRGDDTFRCFDPGAHAATEEDWSTEYLDLVLSVRVVDSLEDAIGHINRYGSRHSDAIVTSDAKAAQRFLAEVDSAAVFWNASTRFNDGEEFGFGAEIGISTDKLHARGPMALPELTSYKYHILGSGQMK
ncbi:MAG TPA: glutamate-5-semialdehyde dehydrogenase [Verrucomicrobiales bacterium]|nr:glutamate-5-semialdehyde dehydrogenase [Verrucomicrobiales bacterium]